MTYTTPSLRATEGSVAVSMSLEDLFNKVLKHVPANNTAHQMITLWPWSLRVSLPSPGDRSEFQSRSMHQYGAHYRWER
jgi:hypothetical protein